MESTLETIYIKRGLQNSFIGDRAVRFRENRYEYPRCFADIKPTLKIPELAVSIYWTLLSVGNTMKINEANLYSWK